MFESLFANISTRKVMSIFDPFVKIDKHLEEHRNRNIDKNFHPSLFTDKIDNLIAILFFAIIQAVYFLMYHHSNSCILIIIKYYPSSIFIVLSVKFGVLHHLFSVDIGYCFMIQIIHIIAI